MAVAYTEPFRAPNVAIETSTGAGDGADGEAVGNEVLRSGVGVVTGAVVGAEDKAVSGVDGWAAQPQRIRPMLRSPDTTGSLRDMSIG